ncbi:hypothetical protein WJX84_007851 [Apatococcus fuscideae]|uniref:Plus3 domain-containing protein n=1 Tax=Apatococcus fuscideae TaxID=2026836 RepID=A0AAW1SVY3_9CHLO
MADLDLEEELLQVAGRKRPRAGARELSDDDGSDISEDEAPKRARSRAGAPSRRSAAARAASSGESSDAGLEEDGYDSELVGDEADRARLNKMSELDREMILAERSEAREQAKERRRQAQMVEQRTRDTRAIDKAKEMRSSTRMKAGDAPKKAAMAELAAARQQRDDRKSGKPEGRKGQYDDESGDESLSDSDEEAEERRDRRARPPHRTSDGDEDEQPSDDSREERLRRRDHGADLDDRYLPGEEALEAEEADFEDAKIIVVSRARLEQWVDEPFFERTMAGLLARVSLPVSKEKKKYLLLRIIGVVDRPEGTYKDLGYPFKSPYSIGDPPKKTSKWLLSERGTSKRHLPIQFISNSPPTEEEWDDLVKIDRNQGQRALLRLDIQQGSDRLHAAKTYKYTPADLQKKIQDRRDRGAVGNLVAEQARLTNLLTAAQDIANIEEEQRLLRQLADIELRLAAQDKSKRKDMSEVNKRNVKANMNAVTAKEIDPFARRATKPGSYWKVKRAEAEIALADGMPLSKSELDLASMALNGASLPDTAAKGLEKHSSGLGAEPFKLGIDLSRLKVMPHRSAMARRLGGASSKLYLSPAARPTNLAGKSRLTLADYRRRHGL